MVNVVNLDKVWNIVYIEDGCSKVQVTEDSDEAEDIIRDLVAKGVPVESIRVYSPDTSQDVHWLEYHLQQLYVKILTPGPALEGLINEVQRLIENYVPTVCEVSVGELTTYTGNKEELRAVDTHEGERGVLRKHLMEEILHAALARTSDEGAIAILQETMRRVDKLTPGNMLSDIYAARSIGEVTEHDGLRKQFMEECIRTTLSSMHNEKAMSLLHAAALHVDSITLYELIKGIHLALNIEALPGQEAPRKQFIIECLQAASQEVSTTDAIDVLSRARDNIDTLDINGLIKALSTAYTKSASVRRKK
jgi:hypothetical protein